MRNTLIVLTVSVLLMIGCVGFGFGSGSSLPFERVTDEFDFDYQLSADGVVDVNVMNCYMNNIRILINGELQTSGSHTSSWDLLDEYGIRVEDGIYYIQIMLDDDVIETDMYEVYK
ncbi:MAG: hypothetical protein ABFR50_06740 [Candidatus Fermentibacteria bacterium]